MMCQSVDIISGSSGGVCLICNGSIKEVKISTSNGYPSSSPLLSRDLYVYFVVRHVLDLPLEHLNRFMVQCPKLIDWLEVCDSCNDNHLEKCKNLFLELVEVKKKFDAAKLEVALKIQRSVNEREETTHKEAQRGETICHVARQYVIKAVKQGNQQTNPSRNGDLLAQEKLASKTASQLCSQETLSTNPTSYPVESPIPLPRSLQPDDQDNADFELKLEPMSPLEHEQDEQDAKPADNFKSDYDSISENAPEDPDWDENSFGPCTPSFTNAASDGEEDWTPKKRKSKARKRKAPQESSKIKIKDCSPRRKNELPSENKKSKSRRRRGKKLKPSVKRSNWLTCRDCGWRTKHSLLFKYHKKKVHGDDGKKSEENPHSTSDPGPSSSKHNVTVKKTNASIKCDQCSKEFTASKYLLCHMGRFHGLTNVPKYTCTFPNCGKSFFYSSNLPAHEATHKPPQYKCDVCGIIFKVKKCFIMHMIGHEETIERSFKCDLCPSAYSHQIYLNQHIKRYHDSVPPKTRYKDEGELKCSLCDFKSFRHSVLERHLAKMHGGLGEIINPENDPLQNPAKMYVCELCGWKTALSHSLRKHNKEAHGIVELNICKVEGCGQSFPNSTLLRKHEYTHEKTFQCKTNEKIFTIPTDLQVHKKMEREIRRKALKAKWERERRKKLSKETPPLCSICGNLFANKDELKMHINRIHEKKLEKCCELCGKIVSRQYHLKMHMAAVHKIGNPEFQCKVEGCSRMFVRKKELDKHMETHGEVRSLLECQLCGKKLANKNSLSKHIRKIHRNANVEKPIKCEVCGRGFSSSRYLWQHIRIHKKNGKEEGSDM